MQRIFLDNNSTMAVKTVVRIAIGQAMSEPYNPSSVHSYGREAKKFINTAREQILQMAKAENADVIFTSNGTEANNLALSGLKDADSIAVSATEHISVLKPAELQNKTSIIPVNADGIVELDTLKKVIENAKGKTLVSVMMANNETGIIQPIAEIAELVSKCGGYIHCDAIQAFGRIPVNFSELGVDMMTISSHKIGGGQGAAAIIVRKDIELSPIVFGGQQENGLRAGTENVSAIVGFGVAAGTLAESMDSGLRDYLEDEIKNIVDSTDDIVICGENVDRLPNTSCIALKNMSNETQLINFDLAGIAVSNGAACSSGTVKDSHVLKAMGVEKDIASSAIRISLSDNNTKAEVDKFIEVWKRNYEKAKEKLMAVA